MVTLRKKALDQDKQFSQYTLISCLDFGNISLLRPRSIGENFWNPIGDWRLIILGTGFFMLKLDSRDDFMIIWSQKWKMSNQVVRFIKWSL